MICENCGKENLEGSRFCIKCGLPLEKKVKIDRKVIEAPRKALVKVIETRKSTDEIVSRSWIAAMLLLYIVTIIIGLAIVLDVVGEIVEWDASDLSMQRAYTMVKDRVWLPYLLNVFFYIFASALAYLLVSRLNRHYERDRKLRASMLSFVSSAANSPELKNHINFEYQVMNQTDNVINSTERRRNPLLWALIVASPLFVGLIQWWAIQETENYSDYNRYGLLFSVLNLVLVIPLFDLSFYLGKSSYKHHIQWLDFGYQTNAALMKLGFKDMRSYWIQPMQPRAYGIYTLVTIITLGLFMFYWWYTLIEDPNKHLRSQWEYENSLIETIS